MFLVVAGCICCVDVGVDVVVVCYVVVICCCVAVVGIRGIIVGVLNRVVDIAVYIAVVDSSGVVVIYRVDVYVGWRFLLLFLLCG